MDVRALIVADPAKARPASGAREPGVLLSSFAHHVACPRLAPQVIADLIRTEIEALIVPEQWRKALTRENQGRKAPGCCVDGLDQGRLLLGRRPS